MTDLVARVLLKADGSGFVGQVRGAKAEVDGLKAGVAAAAVPAAALGKSSSAAAAGIGEAAAAARQADGALDAMRGGAIGAAGGADMLEAAIISVTSSVVDLSGVEQRLAGVMGVVEGQTAALVAELRAVAAAHAAAAGAAERDGETQQRAARGAEANAAAILRIVQAVDPAAAEQMKLNQLLAAAEDLYQQGAISAERFAQVQEHVGRASAGNVRSIGQQRAAYTQFGQQFSDVTTTLSLGISPLVVLAQQGGQVAYAIDQMGLKGAGGRLAAFFAGPWGAIVLAAGVVLGPLVAKLWEAGEAAENAKVGASGLAEAQGVLGGMFDLTSGKLRTQNELLRLNARLTAINLRADALKEERSSTETFDDAGRGNITTRFLNSLSRGGPAGRTGFDRFVDRRLDNVTGARDLVGQVRSGAVTSENALRQSEKMDFTGSKVTREEFQQAIIDAASSTSKKRIADLIDETLDSGKLADELKRPDTSKPKDTSKAKAALAEFGRDAVSRIASLGASFGDTPSQVEKVNRALAQLDDLVDDIARKKPPGFEKLLADARAAREAIKAGLDEPYRDFLEAQTRSLEVGRLILAGRQDEADALKAIHGLERQMGPLDESRKDAVLATVQALRQQQRETEILQARQQKYLDALDDVRGTVKDILSDGIDGLKDLPGRLTATFKKLAADIVFDDLFDGIFRDLEDQVKGTSKVEDASARMETAVDRVSGSLYALGRAADAARGGVAPAPAAAGPIAAVAGAGAGTTSFFGSLFGNKLDAGQAPAVDGEITVTGRKRSLSAQDFMSNTLTKLAKGVGISDEAATKIGQFGGKAIKGAAEGALVNSVFAPIAKGLGLKTSNTGAQLGGAIGGALPIPGGAQIGALVGSITGGLLKKTKSGQVTLTSATGDINATGNSNSAKAAATGLAGSVQEGLQQIAEQLGGVLGSFNVTVGQRHGDYRVTTGSSLKVKKGAKDFNDDEAGALSYALQLAISQGAVGGLSDAVQKAIRSSDNVDKALREALGVQALEELLGGLGSQIAAPFRAADKVAKENVRLATTYGLDLVKVEALNARRRADVFDQVMSERLGALRDLAAELSYGDLSDGSAADRRAKLTDAAAAALKDAEAGVDGAADRYTTLARQLLSTTMEAFGTAGGEYASDRAGVDRAVQALMASETQRVKDAQDSGAKVADGVAKSNELLDEGNDQAARQLAATERGNLLLEQLTGGTGGALNTSLTQRVSAL